LRLWLTTPAPSVQSPAQNLHPGSSRCACPCLLLIAVVCSVLRPAPRSGAGMCRISFNTRLPSFFPIPAAAAKKKKKISLSSISRTLLVASSNLQGALVRQIVWGVSSAE
jgi:hypothetical protein